MTRGLAGDLSTMPLKDLVVYLGNRRASGVLDLVQPVTNGAQTRKRVLLREGKVVHASSNQPREYFGQFLINMGQLDESQFLRVYEEQQQRGVSLGLLLATAGGLPERTVTNALSLKFRETLYGVDSEYDADAEGSVMPAMAERNAVMYGKHLRDKVIG